MGLDLDRIAGLMAQMHRLGIAELDWRHGAERIRLVRGAGGTAPAAQAPPPAPLPAPLPTAGTPARRTIAAPMHGVFYVAPAPGEPPFVRPGDTVAAGQTLYIIEVMKTLSRIGAEQPCRIVSVEAQDAQDIAPGMPLFVVEALDA